MTRPIVLALVLAVAAGPLAAQRQPAAPQPTVPLIVRLLPFVSDENFGKALKLTPEQVKTFTDFRQKQWDEQYTSAADKYAESTADRDKATVELFKKTLSEEQHKRATQLATQYALTGGFALGGGFGFENTLIDPTRVPATTLNQFPELAAPLNLTDEQKKLLVVRVNAPTTAQVVYLTAEQVKVVKEMTGEPVNLNWVSAFDERLNRSFRGSGPFGNAPGLLGLTESMDVRTDLGLTEEQTKTLADLAAKWRDPVDGSPARSPRVDRTLSPEQQIKANEQRLAEAEKALAAALKPEQLTRLKQISIQTDGGNSFRGSLQGSPIQPPALSEKLSNPEVRKALALTDAQAKALADADKAQADATEKAMLSDAAVDDSIKLIAAARAAREKAYETVVSAEQKKKLDELLGKPFAGSTVPDRMSGGSRASTLKNMRMATFGKRLAAELNLLASNKAIQGELGLTPDQLKAITDKATDASTKFGRGIRPTQDPAALEKTVSEQAEFAEKALADILTAQQVKRLHELMIQRAEFLANRTPVSPAVVGAVGVPGVAETVKLTAEQKKKLLEDGVRPDEVLTAEQKAKITELAGKKYDGDFVLGTGTGGSAGPAQRVNRPTTVAILRGVPLSVFQITPEQADKLAVALNRYQLETQPEPQPVPVEGGGWMGRRVDPAKLAAADEALTKAVAATLTAEQLARVEQVKYQAMAQTAGITLLAHPEVAKALALTKEQSVKNAALVADAQRLSQAGPRSAPGGFRNGLEPWREKYAEKVNAKVLALLTDEQKATWKRLTGDPVPNLPPTLASPVFSGGF